MRSVNGNRESIARAASRRRLCVAAALAGILAGCAVRGPEFPAGPGQNVLPPRGGSSVSIGNEIVLRAVAQIGTVYRYGGADLEGFDCSGLVYFIHQELGLTAPRTAQQQFAASTPIARNDLAPGDLVFFRTAGARISHVGIYAGDGRFIHAPQTGRNVELKNLDDRYYASHFAGAGRLQRAGGGL